MNDITGNFLCVPPLMEKGIKAKFYLFFHYPCNSQKLKRRYNESAIQQARK